MLTDPAGENFDLKVRLSLHNVGAGPVYDVHAEDSWSEEFRPSANAKDGNKCHFDVIEPSINVSCEIIVVPLRYGTFTPKNALAFYRLAPDAEEVANVVGHPFSDGALTIFPHATYKRLFTSHKREILAFLCLAGAVSLIPYALFI